MQFNYMVILYIFVSHHWHNNNVFAKNWVFVLTNVFKNGNINTVVRHKLTFVFIWRGGRVGLWHQSWKLACVYSVPWVRIPPSPPTIFDIRPWIYESRFFVLYLFILYYVGVPKWWRGQFAKLLGRVIGAEVRTLSPTP